MTLTTDRRVSRRREAAAVTLTIGGAWGFVVAVEILGVWLAQYRTVDRLYPEAAYLIAVAFTVALAIGRWRHGHPKMSVFALVLSAAVALPVLSVDWTRVSVHAYYRVHRGEFVALTAYVQPDGAFIAGAHDDVFPAGLEQLTVDASATTTGGGTVLLLPVWADYPDLPGAFVHPGDAQPAGVYDCFESRCHLRWPLGDGWYWYERDPVSWAARSLDGGGRG